MKLKIIEKSDKRSFESAVGEFLTRHDSAIRAVKFQRNLFYSLSGSTKNPKEIHKETSSLKEGYVAFLVYEERSK